MKDGKLYSAGWEDELDVELLEGGASEAEEPPRAVAPAQAESASPSPRASAPAPRSLPRALASELPMFPRCHLEGYFPAFFARSGLFAAERGLASKQSEASRKVLGQDKVAATVSGARLCMGDKLVFEAVLDLARRQGIHLHEPLRTSGRVSAWEWGCKDSGGGTSRHVRAALARLQKAHVAFDLGDGLPRSGRLVKSIADKAEKGVELTFDPGFILPAFGATKLYRINRARREELPSPMARWLHDFASTHSKPRAIDLKYLRERSGFEGEPRKFVERLRVAAEALMTAAPELLSAYALEDLARSSENWLITLYRGGEKAAFD